MIRIRKALLYSLFVLIIIAPAAVSAQVKELENEAQASFRITPAL